MKHFYPEKYSEKLLSIIEPVTQETEIYVSCNKVDVSSKLLKNWKEQFDKEFPTCDCRNNLPPHFEDKLTNPNWIKNFISQLLSDARREERERCLESMEDTIGSGLKLDPLSFVHIGGRKDIYEVALMGKVGDNPMVIPYNLFKVAVENVVNEQIAKALTTAEESIKKFIIEEERGELW